MHFMGIQEIFPTCTTGLKGRMQSKVEHFRLDYMYIHRTLTLSRPSRLSSQADLSCGMKRASNELEALLKKAAKRKETLHAADAAIAKEKAALEAPPAPAPAPEPAAAPDEADTTAKPVEVAEPTMVPAIFIFAAAPSSIEPLSVAGKVVGDEDPLVAMLAGLDAEQPAAAQLLQGGWIRAHYHTRRPCPPEVLRWLFAVTCHHRRPHVSAAAAHTLGSLLSAAPAMPAWVPSPTDRSERAHV